MKILDSQRVNLGDTRRSTTEKTTDNPASFQKIISSYSKDLTQDRLQQMLQDIDKQGEALSKSPTFQQLRKYKDMIKQFMGEVTKNGIGLHQTDSWDPYGGSKTLKTVQVLDRKLMDLTNHVINQQTEGLSILDRIGEIKGLLINLYT
ncbi:YaaR family protein [Bacillus sp. BRMEA1]|uniref:YaaR family protein n=1 Tax=Neobacillus endophyticus TaxID=2738405 RepID=UPI0015673168|nr:YaaR family protein [Neobacillus endophyticus]NRD79374.1 YaaR family protein [Neobacillus endophyticus]